MFNKLLGGLAVVLSVAVVGFARADSPRLAQQNPYAGIYEKNLAGMHQPDQLLDRVLAPVADLGLGEAEPYAAQSKTCSQRCSTTCSKTCTTTRGCSTQCKKQTDGCGGVVAQPPATAPATSTTRLPSGVYLSADVTTHTVANAQRALIIAGYDNLCVNGVETQEFREALGDYQRRHGHAVTGSLTAQSWVALGAELARVAR